jgi:PAS domain S-box-containing protein
MPFRKTSIALTVTMTIVTIVTILLGAVGVYVYRLESRDKWRDLNSTLKLSADQLATALTLPAWNMDNAQIDKNMRGVMLNPDIYGVIFQAEGDVNSYVTSLERGQQWEIKKSDGKFSVSGLLAAERDIMYSHQQIGTLKLFTTPKFIQADLRNILFWNIISVIALDIFILLSLYIVLWRIVLRPLKNIEHYAFEIISHAEVKEQIHHEIRFHGELETVRRAIARMVELLSARYEELCDNKARLEAEIEERGMAQDALAINQQKLKILNDELEQRVQDRTSQLQTANLLLMQARDAAIHEISERRRMEAELRQSRDEWKRTFDAMKDLIFIIDDKHNILRINKAASNALGLLEDQSLSLPCYVYMHGTNKPPENCPHLKTLSDCDTHQVDIMVERLGHHYQVTTTPIFNADGNYEATVHVAHDISERIRYERELQEARQAADAASRAKSEFLSNMSHELRTPMNGVLGMAQLLVLPTLQDDRRMQYAKTILDSGHTLLSLLNDILDLSKVEAGKLNLESIVFAVEPVVVDTCALFAESANAKGLQLESAWQGPAGPCYLGDPYRLRQMLSNLISNAIKFTACGFVRVLACEIERQSQHAVLLFSVSDSGVGITPEQHARLFQPFSQADSSTTRQFGGSGLGLSIVLRLAQLMGGDVGIDSEPGQGARFWFRVRVPIQTEAQDLPQTTAELEAVPVRDLTGTVLIAEDNPVNRMVIMAMLGELDGSGLSVTVVEDGQQALDFITQGGAPDLVLMDVQMPVMGGLAATEQIRLWEADHAQPRTTIVALTANAFEEDRQKCLVSGMDDFLVKPLDMEKLQTMLVRWLQR